MDGERLKEQSQAWSPGRFAPTTTKPGALAPGLCLLSRGAVLRGAGAAVRGFVLGNSRDRFQIRWFSVVGGAAGAGTWGQVSSGTFRSVRGTSGDAVDGVCPLQEKPRQERQRSVEKCWSRGRIVSALLAAAQGGCRPSMEPPNPVAATMGPPSGASKGCSPSDTGLHRGQQEFMKVSQHPSDAFSGIGLQGVPPAGCC